MKLLRGVASSLPVFSKGTVVTIGNFDGVHLGHQNLIASLKTVANEMALPLVVILFEPQPKEYFQQKNAPERLSSLRDKLLWLEQCRVDYVVCIKFNKYFAQMSSFDFVHRYLITGLNVKHLLVGEDFRFAKHREGNVALLKKLGKEFGYQVQCYQDYCMDHEKVSSTKIRSLLSQGHLKQGSTLLGRSYSICGRVVHGAGKGRVWGIPTANIRLHRFSLPLRGVFVVNVTLGKVRGFGVANIGVRPTVDGTKNSLEVHLFDFDKSIYGELMQVFFLFKLRDEIKFHSVDALIAQIVDDITAAKTYLNAYHEDDPVKFNQSYE